MLSPACPCPRVGIDPLISAFWDHLSTSYKTGSSYLCQAPILHSFLQRRQGRLCETACGNLDTLRLLPVPDLLS